MNAMNYLKFDLRIIKESIKYYVLIPVILCIGFIFIGNSYSLGIGYLFFFLVIFATIPFSMQGNEKSTEMYYMFPAKISSMVLGRFLYLICSAIIIFMVSEFIIIYLYKISEINDIEVLMLSLSGLVSFITCFIQYPIYYKFGLEKGKILSIIIYLVPAFIIFMLPDILKESKLLIKVKETLSFNFDNCIIVIIFCLLSLILIGYISYLISLEICKKKEV
jgi:hypothetical protein